MSNVKNLCVYILDLNKFYPIVGYMWDGEPEVKIRDNNGLVYISSEDRYYALIWNGKNFSIGLEPIEPKKESELFEGGEYVQYIDLDYAPENFKYNDHLFNEDKRILQLTKDIILDESNITNYQEAKRLSYTYSIEDDVFKFIEYPEVIYDLNIIVWDTVYDSNFIDSLTPDNNVKFQNTLLQPGEGDYITIKPIEGKYPKETDNYKGIAILGSDGSVLSLALSIEIEPNEKQFKIKFSVPNVINQNCLLFIPENILVPEGEEKAPLLTAVYKYEEPTPPTPPPAPDSEATIVSYSNQTLLNSSTSKTFDGLISYGSISTNNNNVRRKNDTIFINENSGINQIIIHPVLRTLALFSDNTTRVVIYNNDEYPVSVFIVETITNDYETYTKHHVITYNQNYTLPLDARCKKIQITFKVGETTLYRTIQFYKLPDILYTKYFGSGSNNQFSTSEYDSIIDALTGNPIISKYGCLLLTNEYDVIETTEVEENNKTVLKGVAELVPTTKVRMGNLNGIYNETFGTNQPRGFGLYGESVYLTGNFYLNNGKSLIDISNDVTLAVGNIARIQNTLNNLDESLHNSIYNLTLALNSNITGVSGDLHQAEHNLQEQITAVEEARTLMAADFKNALIHNTEALFKLGKDYSIWAVGNAGISIINPNVAYNEDGTVKDETVGDGDEFILLLGESVQIANTKVVGTRIRVICSSIDPTGFNYSGTDLFRPTNATFSIGWINQSDVHYFKRDDVVVPISINSDNGLIIGTGDMKPFRYVALLKHTNTNSGLINLLTSGTLITRTNCDVYQFSKYFINETNDNSHPVKIYTQSSGNTELTNYGFFVYDVVTAGMFSGGKFNADLIDASLINVENLVAVESNYKNTSFNPALPINTTTNYPTTNNSKPFAVISGTTGKITALGVDLKEAVIGNPSEKHIHLTDNQGILEDNDSDPGIYIKNNSDIVAKFCGDNSLNPNGIFDTNGLQTITGTDSTSVTFNKTYTRNLSFCNDSSFTLYSDTKIRSGFRIEGNSAPNNLILFLPYLSSTTGIAKFSVSSDGSSWSTWTNLSQNVNGNGYRTSLLSGPYQKVRIAVPVVTPSTNDDGLIKYGIHITRGSIESQSYFTTNDIDNSLSYYVREFSIKGDEGNYTAIKINYPYFSDDNFLTQFFDDAPYDNDIYEVKYNSSDGNNTIYELNLESVIINGKKSKIIYLESANITCSSFSINGLRNYVKENNSEIVNSSITTLPGIFNEHVSIIAEFYYKQGNTEKVLFKRECSILNTKNYTSDDEFSKKYYIETNILKKSSGNDYFYNLFELNSPIVIYNNSDDSKTYDIKLRIKFEFNGDRKLSSYKWIKNNNSNTDYHTQLFDINNLQICDEVALLCISYTSIDDYIAAGGTIPKPTDDFYTWNPSKSPYQYTFNGTVTIGRYQLKILDNTFETLILANGIGTGFNKFNNLGLFYDKNSPSDPKFTFDLKSNKNGLIFNKDGMFNIINNLKIPRYVPILLGNILTTLLNDNVYRYNFSGTSLINGSGNDVNYSSVEGFKYDSYPLGKIIDLNSLWRLTINISPTKSSSVSYSNKHDICLIRADLGKLILVFGEKWNNIFNDNFTTNQFFIYLFGRNTKMCIPVLISVNDNGNSLTLLNGTSVAKYLNNKYWIQINIMQFTDNSRLTTSLLQDGDLSISIHYTPNTI